MVTDQDLANNIKLSVSSLQTTASEFAVFSAKMSDGKGLLSRLATDEKIGNTLDTTLVNLQSATMKLDENMEALQSNFLLRGFFKKKEKEETKKLANEKKATDARIKNDLKAAEEMKKVTPLFIKDTLLR